MRCRCWRCCWYVHQLLRSTPVQIIPLALVHWGFSHQLSASSSDCNPPSNFVNGTCRLRASQFDVALIRSCTRVDRHWPSRIQIQALLMNEDSKQLFHLQWRSTLSSSSRPYKGNLQLICRFLRDRQFLLTTNSRRPSKSKVASVRCSTYENSF